MIETFYVTSYYIGGFKSVREYQIDFADCLKMTWKIYESAHDIYMVGIHKIDHKNRIIDLYAYKG